MKRIKRLRALVFPISLLAFAPLAKAVVSEDEGWRGLKDIPAATGFAALDLCSRLKVTGDDYWHVRKWHVAPRVHPLPFIWDIDFPRNDMVSVHTILPFFVHRRMAVYREGLGCTPVLSHQQADDVRSLPFIPYAEKSALNAPWPMGENPVEDPRLDSGAHDILSEYIKNSFVEQGESKFKRTNANALLVAKDDHLVFEHYRQGYQRAQLQTGWSMTKTVTALIFGVMASEGIVHWDEPVGLSSWEGTEKANITWRQLLNMAPGLDVEEDYSGKGDTAELFFEGFDQTRWTAERPLIDEPGTEFRYFTGTPTLAMYAMMDRLGGSHQAIYDYYQEKLLEPMGIRGGFIETDPTGTPIGGGRGQFRPVDWLRFGQLLSNHGMINGEQIISEDVMDFLLTPSPATPKYGAYIWLKPKLEEYVSEETLDRLPDDLIMMLGHMGQLTYVSPSENLVVTQLSVGQDRLTYMKEFTLLFAELFEHFSQH